MAPRLSRACTTEARPFRAAMWSGLERKETGTRSPQGTTLPFHSQPEQHECRTNPVSSREALEGGGLLLHPPAPPARSPLPRHSHLQRTVGSIDEAKVLGLRQDHEGTLLMALRERDRGGGGADRLQSGRRADRREDKELHRLHNPDGRSRPLSSRADPPPRQALPRTRPSPPPIRAVPCYKPSGGQCSCSHPAQ